MMTNLSRNWRCGLATLAAVSGLTIHTLAQSSGYLSPLALVANPSGKTLYIAEATANQVVAFDLAGAKVIRVFSLAGQPTGLALSSDGARLYVTGGVTPGHVCIFEVATGQTTGKLPAGHTPGAPVLSPDGQTLYVCNRFNHDVAVFDLITQKQTASIPVSREPVAAAITPDGAWLFVANLLPPGPADGDYAAAAVSVIDTAARKVATSIALPNGSTGLEGICLSPDGRHVYVTHTLSRYQLPTTQLERGWMNTSALSVIDAVKRDLINTVLLDDVDSGAANPWGVACTADGKSLCVAHAGTHEVSVIDRAKLHENLAKVAVGEKVSNVSLSAADVPNDLAFLVDLRRRFKLQGKCPRGLVIVGAKVYVAEYFSDTVGVMDLPAAGRAEIQSLALGPTVALTAVRRGEMLFNDATLCFQHWQSCASCHPGEARADGLNWDLLNDGLGNPKNAKSMLLAHRTPPAMSLGVRDTAEVAVRAGIKHILFAVRPEEEAQAMDEYLKSLQPVPSPHLVRGQLSEAALRGQTLFDKVGCSECHPAPLYTDLETHDIKSGKDLDKDHAFDTPTLIEVWRTAPYLHDGRATTMKDLLNRHNPNDAHGKTSGLTEDQLSDLAEYVLSL